MDMRSNKVLSSIIASMMVLMAIMAVLPATTQAAWYDNPNAGMAFTPKELFKGETYPAAYTLTFGEEAGVTQVTITQALVQYGWESSPTTIFSGSVNVNVFPYTYVFNHNVAVPEAQAAGTYAVNVTVVAYVNGDIGTISESTHIFTGSVVVANEALGASATADPTTGLAPQDVSFDVTASGGNGSYSYAWKFGDGATGSGQSPTHTYTAAGTYTANVTVTDNLGRSTYATTSPITIAPGIMVNITAQPSSGPFPLQVKFNSTVDNAAAGDLTYAWKFGDGGTSTDAAPTHTYSKQGDYSVVLNVTDSRGRNGTSSALTVIVTASANVVITVSASTTSGTAPLDVSFTSQVSGGTPPYTYSWDFGDGATSTLGNPSHTYTESSIYHATLTVTDSASQIVTSKAITITVKSDTTMEVTIDAANMTGSKPLTVSFTSTIVNGTGPYFYTWDFDDGTTSTQAKPVHVFDQAGKYNVTLSVQDSLSNVTISNNLTIVVTDPPATTIPAWVWIWGSTAIIIVATGAIAFVMMRRRR